MSMKNNIRFLLLIILVIFLFSFPAMGQNIDDMDEDHWAYESVQELIDRGYLNLYEDDTFRGNESISRYEMAEIVSRLLADLQDTDTELEEEDVEEIRKLSLEFRDELVEIAQEQDDFSQALEDLQDENIIRSEEIGDLNEQLESQQEELTGIVDNILELKKKNEEVDDVRDDLSDTKQELEETREELTAREKDIEKLKDQLKESVDTKIEEQNTTMESEIQTMDKRIGELETRLEEEKEGSGENTTALFVGGAAVLAILLTS